MRDDADRVKLEENMKATAKEFEAAMEAAGIPFWRHRDRGADIDVTWGCGEKPSASYIDPDVMVGLNSIPRSYGWNLHYDPDGYKFKIYRRYHQFGDLRAVCYGRDKIDKVIAKIQERLRLAQSQNKAKTNIKERLSTLASRVRHLLEVYPWGKPVRISIREIDHVTPARLDVAVVDAIPDASILGAVNREIATFDVDVDGHMKWHIYRNMQFGQDAVAVLADDFAPAKILRMSVASDSTIHHGGGVTGSPT